MEQAPNIKKKSSSESFTYVIESIPESLSRPQYCSKEFIADQKELRARQAIALGFQHTHTIFKKPISLDIEFRMPIDPSYTPRKQIEMAGQADKTRPRITDLIRWIEEIGTEILWEDSAVITVMNAKKIFHPLPCTIFTIKRVE